MAHARTAFRGTDDPNGWSEWVDEPFNLIRHLRRLIRVSYESAETIAWLPTSRPGESHLYESGPITWEVITESIKHAEPLQDSTGVVYTDEEFDEHLRSQPHVGASG